MNLKNGFATALVITAAIAISATLASVANGQPAPSTQPGQPVTPIPEIPAPSAAFVKLDRDKNGSLSKAEATRNKDLAKRWDSLDGNKDGKLDSGEFALFDTTPPGQTGQSPTDSQKSLDNLKSSTPVL
jgi:hypothetical protein